MRSRPSTTTIITRDPNASTSLNIFQSAHGFILVFRCAFLQLLHMAFLTSTCSLTQETSLREIEDLRQRIYHIRGDDRVSVNCALDLADSYQFLALPCPALLLHQSIPIIVVGTKLDLTTEREVPQELIRRYAVRWGVPFYETSSKRNWNVRPAFEDLVRRMRTRFPYPTKTKTRRGVFRRAKTYKTFTDSPRPNPDRCLIM